MPVAGRPGALRVIQVRSGWAPATAARHMIYAKELIDLQVSFAERVRAWSGMPLEQALLEYTNLYIRLGLGRSFDPEHETWRAYLAALRTDGNARAHAQRLYAQNAEANTAAPAAARFGCFSYALLEGDVVRLHFRNAGGHTGSPLAPERSDERRAELAALFGHARASAGDDAVVLGTSWLYQLVAYRRLFPPAYVASARVARARFQSMSLWGQFVDHRGGVKPALERRFTSALAEQPTLDGAERCFPLQPLAVQAPVRAFCDFYGL